MELKMVFLKFVLIFSFLLGARYAAREFVQRGVGKGELAIITEEPVRWNCRIKPYIRFLTLFIATNYLKA